MNKRAEILPRNVIISLLLFILVITAGISAFSLFLGEQSISVDQNVNSTQDKIDELNSKVGVVVSSVDSNSKTDTGIFGSFCQNLLGDSAFCLGLGVLDVAKGLPSIIYLSFGVIKNINFPFQVPTIFWVTLKSIMIVLIVFILVSSWRRWKS